MPKGPRIWDAMHFRSLELGNVCAFGTSQSLQLVNEDGGVSRWNLILGENGVGKTTLMRALAVMRPVPAYGEPPESPNAPPNVSSAELSECEDESDITRFIRRNGLGMTTMTATLETEARVELNVGVTITTVNGKLEKIEWHYGDSYVPSLGPLLIGYGAGRHLGITNLDEVSQRKPTESLFAHTPDRMDLYDAEEIMEKLDYGAHSNENPEKIHDQLQLETIISAVTRLLPDLPDLSASDIEINGPRVKGRDQSGVIVNTPSGKTPLADLSLGYQTMFAWTVDLAWRLFQAFPESAAPLEESAIVLIDEVDLHLHPRWQRSLREHLLYCFPRVQFIATTHSPITAQETLSDGGNVAVVRWVNGEAHIINKPVEKGEWRSDQLMESDLFEFGADRSQKAEAKIYKRIALIRKPNRSEEEEAELCELDKFVASLPTAPSPNVQGFEDLMLKLAKDYPSGVTR